MALTAVFLTVMSFVFTGLTISNAFYQKKQFYPSVVYLTKSSPSMAILYVQGFVFALMVTKLVKKLFFGQLRAAETENLTERAWYAVTETCLAFTVFRDDFSPRFVAQFTLLLFLKCFHWLAEDRVDYMERVPVITVLFHTRMMGIIAVLSAIDSYFVSHAYFTTLLRGASVQIVFGFEYAILMTIVFHVAVKYLLHTNDLRNAHPWESKAVYLLYTELAIDFIRCVLYTVFVIVMIRLHTFPLFSIRPFYLNLRAFKKALKDVVQSRRAIHAMNTLFADASQEDLQQGDSVCIICREEISATPVGSAKKLPCGHPFHAACLRSWFQRQQTCPTCRSDILAMSLTPTTGAPPRQTPPVAPAAHHRPAQANGAVVNGPAPQRNNDANNNNPFANLLPPLFPPPAHAQMMQAVLQQQARTQQTTTGTASTSATADTPSTSTAGQPTTAPAAGALPPFPMMPHLFPPIPSLGGMPGAMPFPMPNPPSFSGLSEAEVRAMEGQERRNVEARITTLRNIQTLLDAAAVQLQQYTSMLGALAASPHFTADIMAPETERAEGSSNGVVASPLSSPMDGGDASPSSPAVDNGPQMAAIRERRLQKLSSVASGSSIGQSDTTQSNIADSPK